MARGIPRRLLAAALPVVAIAFAWSALETGSRPRALLVGSLLAALTCVPARLPARVAVAAITLVVVGVALTDRAPAAIRSDLTRGLTDIYAVAPPFERAQHPELHALVVLAGCAFCLAVAATAADRPFLAAGLAAAGVAWPATLMSTRNTVAMGVLVLAAALWPVVVAGIRDRTVVRSAAVMASIVVVAAVLVAGAGAKPSTAALDWEHWDAFGGMRAEHAVSLVWNADYTGVDFPHQKTTMLRITAPRRALYWRATTLDGFASDHWYEALYPAAVSNGGRVLPRDDLLPRSAATRAGWVRQDVDVRALIDNHVIGAGQPMQIAVDADQRIQYQSGGVMRAPDGLDGMRRYTVWSYAPSPSPAALAEAPPYTDELYPQLGHYLDVGRAAVPFYGTPGRDEATAALFRDRRYQPLWPYRPLWREASRITAGTGSPYAATVAIERWLRATGGFTYDEHPPAGGRQPPLVAFVERTKRGYCQHFAGAMALMLRYLGIPARVAVGFTSGTWKDGTWTVTDHDAHAWVEAWFPGYGWLTFDPTPGRGTLTATYTNASDSADAYRFLGTGRFRGQGPGGNTGPPPTATPSARASDRATPWPLGIPFAAAGLALGALGLVKAARRRRRAASNDPRRRASAARAELTDFVRDQGSHISASASVGELGLELRRLGVASDAFAEAFSRARYGPPAGAGVAASEARAELARILRLLRSRLGPGRRIRGFLALRSLRGGEDGAATRRTGTIGA